MLTFREFLLKEDIHPDINNIIHSISQGDELALTLLVDAFHDQDYQLDGILALVNLYKYLQNLFHSIDGDSDNSLLISMIQTTNQLLDKVEFNLRTRIKDAFLNFCKHQLIHAFKEVTKQLPKHHQINELTTILDSMFDVNNKALVDSFSKIYYETVQLTHDFNESDPFDLYRSILWLLYLGELFFSNIWEASNASF